MSQTVHIHCINDLQKIVEDRISIYTGTDIKIQPFIIIVGDTIYNLEAFYVYCCQRFYQFDNFLKCVDLLLKFFKYLILSTQKKAKIRGFSFKNTFLILLRNTTGITR